MPSSSWYRSFYWRIGITFVVFVLAVLVVQSVMFSYVLAGIVRQAPPSPNTLANAIAAEAGMRLEADPSLDLSAFLQSRHRIEGRPIFIVMRNGAVAANSSSTLSENIRRNAVSTLSRTAESPGADSRSMGPVVTAPIQIEKELWGLVVLPPPPGGVLRDVGRLLSLPGTAVLIIATVAVAFVLFGPARRRLSALEAAAHRLGNGDLTARAPRAGGDEIARVADAFNRMADELQARDTALRTSDALRRQMFADVSHELKTPLTAMRGYIETLRMPEIALDDARRDRYLETIDRETRRLERIVKDLLDLARYEHGGVTLDRRFFDVERLFQHVAGRHERNAAARGVMIRIAVAEMADQILGDPDRLEQVVENLVVNALRHTPRDGAIELRASVADGSAVLSVTDSGEGIAPEHVPHVFERFYKGDPARAAETSGSGLGLSIAKAIVDRHRGTIGVASRPGCTTFTITLPQRQDETDRVRSAP